MTERHPVIFVGAGPGDPELITVKGMKVLSQAEVLLYAGSLVSPAVLAWAPPEAEMVDTAPLALEEIVARLTAAHRAGKHVVRLHSGDTSLFSALQEQVALLEREGIPSRVIPGVTAASAAAAALVQELTLPEVTQTVILTRAEGRTPVPPRENLRSLAGHGATLVIYLSVQLLDRVVEQLADAYGPETPVVVAYRVSWPDERLIRSTLADIIPKVRAAGITRQALILIGPALATSKDRLQVCSRLYDKTFAHGYRDAAD
ncbi:MAG TPA: precorrin-4 C(11)-methyltransferase [Desulfobacterales bacterium]|nr:precorrin-4 C(11)-methyltransferase [Desulfobacterales bacterium]